MLRFNVISIIAEVNRRVLSSVGVVVALCAFEVVAELLQKGNVECGHHLVVFMDKVVAVEHVDAVPGSEVSEHLDDFTRLEEDSVLQAGGFVRQQSARATRSRNHLERD